MPRLNTEFVKKSTVLAVAAIILTGLLTYLPGITRLGYYHDDWYMLWSGAVRGAQSLIPLFSIDRPFMGVIYSIAYRVIGENIIGWHLSALAWRILGALAFYWILNLAWPKLKGMYALSSMLFIVYPGFLSEPNAATKINHLIGFGSALISISLSLQALKAANPARRKILNGLSLVLMAFYLWIYEYMIGLEVMRLVLIFWTHWQGDRAKTRASFKTMLRAYIPNLCVIGLFAVWRVLIFDSTRNATDLQGLALNYLQDFVNLVLRMVFQTIKDFFSTVAFAWGVQPYDLVTRASNSEMILASLAAAVVIALAVGYLALARKIPQAEETDEAEHFSPYVLIVCGALTTLAAVAPVVATIHHINLLDEYKSYGLHPSPGVIIMLTGVAAMLKPKFRNLTLIALIGLSAATQSLNTQDWIKYWDVQREFWWQLTWRAPNIQDDTLVMAYAPDSYPFQQDYEIWGPVNLIYRPDPDVVPAIQAEVLNTDTIYNIFEGKWTDPHVRDIFVPRDYKRLLLISQPTMRSCIHVIDGQMPAYASSERLIVEKAGGYSNISLIDPVGQAPLPPETIFGQEPERGWCYHYQQAALARQTGNWQRIVELFDAASQAGYQAADASEYFVFIEGLANQGRDTDAQALIDDKIKPNNKLVYSLCRSIAGAPAYPDDFGYRRDTIYQMICK